MPTTKVCEMELDDIRISARDFLGERSMKNFGECKPSFSIEITDPELEDQLRRLGANLRAYDTGKDEPPKQYLTVNVNTRYGDCHIIIVDPYTGDNVELAEENFGEVNKLWIKSAKCYLSFSAWSRGNRSGVSAYCKVLVIFPMTDEEKEEAGASRPNNALYQKYAPTR